jgi:hypothetical protein
MQMPAIFANRTVVVSGGASWVNELRAPMRLAAPADDNVARKPRRSCIMYMIDSLVAYISLFLSSRITGDQTPVVDIQLAERRDTVARDQRSLRRG